MEWHGVRGVLLDLDGVIYRSGAVLPGAREFFRVLAEHGLPCCALTNNARATPEAYERKLAGMGIELPAARIVTAGSATAEWLVRHGHGRFAMLGSAPLRECLLARGLEERADADMLIIGIDADLAYRDLCAAVNHLLRPGTQAVATNADRLIPVAGGYEPECGAIIAFLEYATGRLIPTIGKPNPWIFRYALEQLAIAPGQAVMVGDTVDTDIVGARAAGVPSVLVETGSPIPRVTPAAPTLRLPDIRAVTQRLTAALGGAGTA